MPKLSSSSAIKAIRALGLRATYCRDDAEFRVSWPCNEGAAYYTSCASDAVATAERMISERAPRRDLRTESLHGIAD